METLPRPHLRVDHGLTLVIDDQSPARPDKALDPCLQTIPEKVLAQGVYCLKVILRGDSMDNPNATLRSTVRHG